MCITHHSFPIRLYCTYMYVAYIGIPSAIGHIEGVLDYLCLCKIFLSLSLSLQWFFANYLYALALVSKSVALVNTLSSMSSVFVVIMAALPLLHREPGDKITLSRILVTLLRSVGTTIAHGGSQRMNSTVFERILVLLLRCRRYMYIHVVCVHVHLEGWGWPWVLSLAM